MRPVIRANQINPLSSSRPRERSLALCDTPPLCVAKSALAGFAGGAHLLYYAHKHTLRVDAYSMDTRRYPHTDIYTD